MDGHTQNNLCLREDVRAVLSPRQPSQNMFAFKQKGHAHVSFESTGQRDPKGSRFCEGGGGDWLGSTLDPPVIGEKKPHSISHIVVVC